MKKTKRHIATFLGFDIGDCRHSGINDDEYIVYTDLIPSQKFKTFILYKSPELLEALSKYFIVLSYHYGDISLHLDFYKENPEYSDSCEDDLIMSWAKFKIIDVINYLHEQ